MRRDGIGPITFHGLRLTHPSTLLREGVHPKADSERAGHLPAVITLGLYRPFTKTLQLDAAERVDMAIGKALEGRN